MLNKPGARYGPPWTIECATTFFIIIKIHLLSATYHKKCSDALCVNAC